MYEKSKEVQEKFLNSVVSIERDPIVIERSAKESDNSTKKEHAKIDVIEVEQILGKLFDFVISFWIMFKMGPVLWTENSEPDDEQLNDAIDSNNEDSNDVGGLGSDAESDTQNNRKSKRRRRSKNSDTDYLKLFNENKHLLDMTCDCCSTVFESLEEARDHYLIKHGNYKGYIKAIKGRKLFHRFNVSQYLSRQLNPDKFEYVYDKL